VWDAEGKGQTRLRALISRMNPVRTVRLSFLSPVAVTPPFFFIATSPPVIYPLYIISVCLFSIAADGATSAHPRLFFLCCYHPFLA
jgi:hypothetical protein